VFWARTTCWDEEVAREVMQRTRFEQIPILRYVVVGAGIASEGGAGVVAAAQKTAKRTQSHGAFSMT
jgi:hypothetical protein